MLWSIVALEAVSFTALLTLGAIWAGADIGLIVSLVRLRTGGFASCRWRRMRMCWTVGAAAARICV